MNLYLQVDEKTGLEIVKKNIAVIPLLGEAVKASWNDGDWDAVFAAIQELRNALDLAEDNLQIYGKATGKIEVGPTTRTPADVAWARKMVGEQHD